MRSSFLKKLKISIPSVATLYALKILSNEQFLNIVDIEPLDELEKKRITRIVTTEFPKYFALVSRPKIENKLVGAEGAIISSTVVPQAQAVFPDGALRKPTKIGLQVC